MNAVQLLFAQPWMERLGWTLLQFVWQGVLIAGAFALLRLGLRGPQTRYALGCATLAAMMAAPLATFASMGRTILATSPSRSGAFPNATGAGAAFSTWDAGVWTRALPWLVLFWLVGVMVCSVRLTGGWWVAARLRAAGNRPADEEWREALQRLMRRMGVAGPVKLLVSSRVEAPSVIGWLRPIVLMPLGALTGLPREHVEALLAHELAHVRRHDYLVNVVQSIAEALLFYHPAVWWVSQQIRAEREQCCDDAAIAACGDVLTYARALTNFESSRPAHVRAALTANGGSLRSRIGRLVEPADRSRDMLPGPIAGWALAVLVAVGVTVVGALPAAPTQDAVVNRAAIWVDTVKVTDMQRAVRGLGVLTGNTAAEVKIAESQAKEIQAGQAVALGFQKRTEVVAGRVERVRPTVTNGTVTVEVRVEGALPSGVQPAESVDGIIEIERLGKVACVGRPVFVNQAESEGTLFRLEPDGQSAVRTKVQFGRTSVNTVEIRGGLQPGDRVIVSDMSAYKGVDRVTLR
jgi:beta-lactamase regulating signal transducer with metallopeptidase domain